MSDVDLKDVKDVLESMYYTVSSSRSIYSRHTLGDVVKVYERWLKLKHSVDRQVLEKLCGEMKMFGYDCGEIENDMKRLIDRMEEKYRKLGIDPERPEADKLYELSLNVYGSVYRIMRDALDKGYPLSIDGLENYIVDKAYVKSTLSKDLVELLDGLSHIPREVARILIASRHKVSTNVKEILRYLKNHVKTYLNSIVTGGENREDYEKWVEEEYGKYLIAVRIAGESPQSLEKLVEKWFGGCSLKLLKNPEECRGDIDLASRLYKMYNLTLDAINKAKTSSKKRRDEYIMRRQKYLKILKKLVEDNRDGIERLKNRYGGIIGWIDKVLELVEDIEYDDEHIEVETDPEQTSLTSFLT